ncbi:hypothetical protein [Thiocapsa sp.]|uniref:hypothetical protein n=1 Tax=Thiocapsa sp. TaxID=2024551 RepID=UPI003594531E
MNSEQLIARSISACQIPDKAGNTWQYHSRSDKHSRIACWVVLFDLLRASPLLRTHVSAGKVCFGINHEMRDFRLNRKKNLDLVLCVGDPGSYNGRSFTEYGQSVGVILSEDEAAKLAELPVVRVGAIATVLLALEAKACMTEHVKARPRLYDELASSYQTIHGDTSSAIAAAFVMINTASEFTSPDRNKSLHEGAMIINRHKQPKAALSVLEKVMELPRRSDERGAGFDALGVSMVSCRNDGSPVAVDRELSANVDRIACYDALIQRL